MGCGMLKSTNSKDEMSKKENDYLWGCAVAHGIQVTGKNFIHLGIIKPQFPG